VVLLALARLAVEVSLTTLCVDGVVLVYLYARINDGDDVKAPFSKLGHELLWMGEAFFIPGEDAVAVHVVDVEVEGVTRDVALAEVSGDLAQLVGRLVAVAALLVA
jgi:hypothetical protein